MAFVLFLKITLSSQIDCLIQFREICFFDRTRVHLLLRKEESGEESG